MTPEQRIEFEQLKQLVHKMRQAEDIVFVEQIKRRLDEAIDDKISEVELTDLADVDTSGVTNGQVIKYNSSNQTWENAADIDT